MAPSLIQNVWDDEMPSHGLRTKHRHWKLRQWWCWGWWYIVVLVETQDMRIRAPGVPNAPMDGAQVHILDQRCLCREFEVSVCLTDGFQPPFCWNWNTPSNSNLPVLCLSRFARRRGPRGFRRDQSCRIDNFCSGIHPRWSWWYTMVHALHPGRPSMGGGEAYLNSRKVWCKDIKIFNYLHRPGLGLEQLLCQHRRRWWRIICERSHREQCCWISVPVDCRKVDRFIDIAVLFVQPLLVPSRLL